MSSGTHHDVDDGISLRLHGDPGAAAQARQALGKLRGDIDPPLMETLRLLVTELVTNSVKHAEADSVVLKVLVGRTAVRTEVTDEGPGFDPAVTGVPRRTALAGACSWWSALPTGGACTRRARPPRSRFELLRG